MHSFIKKNWRALCVFYFAIYLPWFFILESKITLNTPDIHIITSPIDNIIPYCEIFIIPYVLWFFYIAAACIYMFFKGSDSEYLRLVLSLMIGMTLAMVICTIYHNGITIRPKNVSNNIFGKMIQWLHNTDTSTNVFPSLHVYNSLAIHISLNKCEALRSHKIIRTSSLILCILICISTLFIKQHSVIDVCGGIILMVILYIFIYAIDYSKIVKHSKSTTKEVKNSIEQ